MAQMQYPAFQAQGWPIGSGMVESANKLVVEARLKGAGMHWSRASVNPLLALRNAVCNDRWAEAWRQSAAHIRRSGITRRLVQPNRAATTEPTYPVPPPVQAVPIMEATKKGSNQAGRASQASGGSSLAAEKQRDESMHRTGGWSSKNVTDTLPFYGA